MKVKKLRAFSLVELLVVVAILAILTTIAVPVSSRAVESAHAARSAQNLRQLVIANFSYATDNGTYAPADDRWNNKRWHGERMPGSNSFDPTKGYLSPYLGGSGAVKMCPLLKASLKGGDSFEDGTGGYGYNAAYVGGRPGGAYDRASGMRIAARPIEVASRETVMFASTGYSNSGQLQEYPYCEPPFWDFGEGVTEWRPSPTVHFRYRDQAIVAWADGRVTFEKCQPREVGFNPHGGDATTQKLGWFGPDAENGFWNPQQGVPATN